VGSASPAHANGGGGGGAGSGSGGGVNRETLKGLQDVIWSDDEVCYSGFASSLQERIV